MLNRRIRLRVKSSAAATARSATFFCCCALALTLSLPAHAQEPTPAQQPSQPATPAPPSTAPDAAQQPAAQQPAPDQAPAAAPAEQAPPAAPAAEQESKAETPQPGGITEEELKRMLVGKPLYLRGGYLDNTLSFGEHGALIGHSPQGSYTLSGIQIDRVHLTKHKVELEGARYGLHFLGALPYEDPTKAVDRVRITPKKKVVKITIDRELVVTPKKKKGKDRPAKTGAPAPAAQPPELSEEEQAKAEMAATPAAERPADPASVTTTISPAHAAGVLKDALDHIFAQGFDDRLMASMPEFWKLYYQAAAAKADYRPTDPSVLRQNTVDKKARLVSTFEPESNEYAQANGVAGMALYHTVIGVDGKPGEIAVGRPIGFGLDENAVAAIRKATFEPAIKDGQPVPVLLDLVVQFRIYSKRTAVAGKPEDGSKPAEPSLPGPYSVQH
jgi:outer membrane biosynthesis protein TonB